MRQRVSLEARCNRNVVGVEKERKHMDTTVVWDETYIYIQVKPGVWRRICHAIAWND